MPVSLPKCRLCGAVPELHIDVEIVPGEASYALACPNPDCWNDTHWQKSMKQASILWCRNPCRGIRGGQGDAADDVEN